MLENNEGNYKGSITVFKCLCQKLSNTKLLPNQQKNTRRRVAVNRINGKYPQSLKTP